MTWAEQLALIGAHTTTLHLKIFSHLLEKQHLIGNLKALIEEVHGTSFSEFLTQNENMLDLVENDFKLLMNVGAKIIYPTHVDYPLQLLCIEKPPVFLSFLGEPVWKRKPTLSVVGSRRPGFEQIRWMRRHIGSFLDRNEVAVASGAAIGIDQLAHELCTDRGRQTIGFIPSGLLEIYPKNFTSKVATIVGFEGAVISEYPPQKKMQTHHFHHRNRLIAGLNKFLLVVQAGSRSGSTMTGRIALQTGVTVGVVAGAAWDPMMSGNLELIHEGALMVKDELDLKILAANLVVN